MLPEDVAIRFEGVSKRYDTREVSRAPGAHRGVRHVDALSDVHFEVRRGESVALRGPNGSGKTTLLRLVAGVTRPSDGTVSVRGRVLALLGPSAAFHPDLSARENALLGCAFHGLGRREARALVGNVLEEAGLRDAADVAIRRTSDGMRLRLALALAFHIPHEVLLCDESFSWVDAEFRTWAIEKVRARLAAGGAVLVATHEPALAASLAGRELRLERGRVVRAGDPHEA